MIATKTNSSTNATITQPPKIPVLNILKNYFTKTSPYFHQTTKTTPNRHPCLNDSPSFSSNSTNSSNTSSMIPTSTIPFLQKNNPVPSNTIAPKLHYDRNPSPSTNKSSIPRVLSLKHLPHNGTYTSEPHPDKHTNLVIASTQTTKTPSASLRKRLSPSHLPTSTNMLSSDT